MKPDDVRKTEVENDVKLGIARKGTAAVPQQQPKSQNVVPDFTGKRVLHRWKNKGKAEWYEGLVHRVGGLRDVMSEQCLYAILYKDETVRYEELPHTTHDSW